MIPSYVIDIYRHRKRLPAIFIAASVARSALAVLLILLIQQFLSVTHGTPKGEIAQFVYSMVGASAGFWVMAALLVLTLLLSAYAGYSCRMTFQRAAEVLEIGIMERLMRHLMALSVQYFNRQSQGDLIQTMRQDVINVRSMAFGYVTMVQDVMVIASLGAVVIVLDPVLTFVSFILVPLVCIPLIMYSRKRLRAASSKLRSTNYALFETVLQLLAGIRVIKVYQAEENETSVCIGKAQKYFDVFFSTVAVKSRVQLMIESLGGLSLMAIITLGGYRVSEGLMTWEKMVAFVFAARSLFTPMYDIYGVSSENNTYRASASRIAELLATQTEIRDRADALPLLRAPNRIRFEDVGFGYQGPQVLHEINFEIREGETIGIVGPSGAGKSTLLNLIVRFYDPTSGGVLFDGVDLRRFRLKDIYDHMGIVTQDPFLFATSVRENIRCAKPGATNDEVEEAAKAGYVHDDILALPDGYETIVGLGGRELSRGQAQRINVARALLRDAKLLVLDEPTSSLDSVAEAEVQKSIDRLMQGRTCFMVAHRLSTLKNADRLIVLDRGRCIAIGHHDDLYNECALYRRLWQLQQLDDSARVNAAPEQAAVVTPA